MACISLPAAMLIGGGISAAGSLGSAAIQSNAASDAAAAQMSMYNRTRSDLSPFITGGGNVFSGLTGIAPSMTANLGAGTNQLATLLGLAPGGMASALTALQNMPGYQWQQQQGQQAVDRSDAAKGLLLSGGQLKDTMAYNQGLASQSYGGLVSNLQNFNNSLTSPLYNLSALGANAAAGVGSAGMQAATNMGNANMAGAQAIAGGINNTGSALNNALSNYLMTQGGSGSSYGTPPGVGNPNYGYNPNA